MPHIMKKKPTEMSKAVPGDVHNIVTKTHFSAKLHNSYLSGSLHLTQSRSSPS